jgi:hypothetical protein
MMLKLSKTNLVALPVKLRLPTETPGTFNEGSITCKVVVLPKERLNELADAGTPDAEYIGEVLKSVEGLGDDEGQPMIGDTALTAVTSGPWSTFLQAAILASYFEQFGDARVKNSKPSRRG